MKLEDKVALVTGSSRGIGLEVVRQLAQKGMTVILSARDLEKGQEVSQIELGFPHHFLQNDTIRDRLYGGMFSAIDNHHRYGTIGNLLTKTSV